MPQAQYEDMPIEGILEELIIHSVSASGTIVGLTLRQNVSNKYNGELIEQSVTNWESISALRSQYWENAKYLNMEKFDKNNYFQIIAM